MSNQSALNISTALYATQGGGIATFKSGQLVWTEVPEEFPEFSIGEPVPEEWDFQPVNQAARQELYDSSLW